MDLQSKYPQSEDEEAISTLTGKPRLKKRKPKPSIYERADITKRPTLEKE